ncbi:MAG: hypothetical protein U0641_09945 [Anaerolineae bacterium]
MSRILLYVFAVVEILIGGFFLVYAIQLWQDPNAGMGKLFVPAFLALGLLFFSGLGVIIGRRWSYYLQFGLIILGVALFTAYYAPLGAWSSGAILATWLVGAALFLFFLLPPVRRHFGLALPRA